jgi:hypothetical protein
VHKPNDNLQESEELNGVVFIFNNNEFNSIKSMEGHVMDYNLLLYIGVGLMVGGFGLFLFSEMKIREIDRKMAENQRFIDAMLKVKR